jgi:hypothetical protein
VDPTAQDDAGEETADEELFDEALAA